MKLQISSGDRQFLLDAAAACPNEEVCGLLLGQATDAGLCLERIVTARNVARDPSRSFEIDPATLLATHREARGAGCRVIGYWHSHPNGRIGPSVSDAARATGFGQNGDQIWLIIAGNDMTAWAPHSSDGGPADFHPVAIKVA